jgi:PAS domain-containing protein
MPSVDCPRRPSHRGPCSIRADAVYLIDPVTSAIVWGNRAAWAMLGLSREDLLTTAC